MNSWIDTESLILLFFSDVFLWLVQVRPRAQLIKWLRENHTQHERFDAPPDFIVNYNEKSQLGWKKKSRTEFVCWFVCLHEMDTVITAGHAHQAPQQHFPDEICQMVFKPLSAY